MGARGGECLYPYFGEGLGAATGKANVDVGNAPGDDAVPDGNGDALGVGLGVGVGVGLGNGGIIFSQ